MPNWCNNVLEISHEDPAEIQRVVAAWNSGQGFFNQLVPRPAIEEENWYAWNIENWGTKWDVESEEWGRVTDHNSTDTAATISYDTAWGPPLGFYEKLTEQGFNIAAYYYEPGMAFCGKWSSEFGNDQYEISGNAAWVKENIPEDIDEMFAIAEGMEMWEDD